KIVAQTRRRDREERLSVGFCDPYAFTASGLMGLFLVRLELPAMKRELTALEVVAMSYPARPHSHAIASRLFSPLGYRVETGEGVLRVKAERVIADALREIPVLLLTLDRRTRLFLTPDELK